MKADISSTQAKVCQGGTAIERQSTTDELRCLSAFDTEGPGTQYLVSHLKTNSTSGMAVASAWTLCTNQTS